MNKTQIIINSVFAALLVVLFVLVFTRRSAVETVSQTPAAMVSENGTAIAYINVDSLLANYELAKQGQERLMKKQEDARLTLNKSGRTLQKEMADFQQKYENNAFLSAERAQNEYQRLQKKQQELEELEAKLTQEIMVETQTLNIELADSLTAFLNDYNADYHYQVILSNNAKDNVLMAAEQYDITNEVIAGMNARFKK